MTQKIQDSNSRVSVGGRLRDYWDERGIEQRRSKAVEWDHKDIDIRALLDKYNLKGFEFGRYVNNEDRYDFLLAAKSALHDLSWLMKTTNLGINGKIGIAFGARGRGGNVLAHYEPMLNMINLTKNKGGHSMAHEYGHALDYNVGMLIDQNKNHAALSAGRSMAKFPEDNTGGTCRLLMRKLIREIKMTDSFKRLAKASDYWHYNTEVFARYFEQWCCYTLRKAHQSNGFLAKSWTEYTTKPQYLTEADFKKVLPTGDKLMKNIGLVLSGKKTEPYMELEVTNPEKVKKAAKLKKEPVKKAATPKKDPVKKAAADPFANMKTLPEKIRDRYYAGEITMRQAAEEFHKAGYDTHVDMEATRKRIGVRPASKKLAEKAAGKTAPKATPKKVAQKASKAAAAGKAMEKLAYQDYPKAFNALSKFTISDQVRPTLGGVYHANGNMVAVDGVNMGVIYGANYPEKHENAVIMAKNVKTVANKGQALTKTYKFPNWEAVIPAENRYTDKFVIDLDKEIARAKAHMAEEKKIWEKWKKPSADGGVGYDYLEKHNMSSDGVMLYPFHGSHYNASKLLKAFDFLKPAKQPVYCYQNEKNRALVMKSGNLLALIMPRPKR